MRDASPAISRGRLLLITPTVAATATVMILAFIGCFILWDSYGRYRDALAAEQQRAEWTARLASSQMGRQFDRMANALDHVGAVGPDAAFLKSRLAAVVLADRAIDAAAVWDEAGTLLAGTHHDGGTWPNGAATRLFLVAAAAGETVPRFALVTLGENGTKQQVLVASRWTGPRTMPGSRLEAVALDGIRVQENFSVPLPWADGTLALFSGDGRPLYPDETAVLPLTLADAIAQRREGSAQDVLWPDGVVRIAAFRWLRGWDALVLVSAGEAAANDAFTAALQRNPAVRGIFVGLIATIGVVMVRRTRNQRSLLRRISLWEQAAETNPHATFITDARQPGNPLIYANPAYEALTGQTRAEMIGRPCHVLDTPEADAPTRERLAAALAEGSPFHGEVAATVARGTHVTLQLDLDPVSDESGGVSNFVCRLRDVTERQRAAEAEQAAQKARDWALGELHKALDRVATSEGRFRDFASSASDWFWEAGADGRIVWLSDNAQDLPGWETGEVPDLPQLLRLAVPMAGAPPASDFRGERAQVRTEDGLVTLEVSGRPLIGTDGRCIGYRGVVKDVTEPERAAAAARREEQRLATAVEHLPIGLLIVDADDRVLLCNASYCELFDVERPRRGDNARVLTSQIRIRMMEHYDGVTVASLLERRRQLTLAGRGSMIVPWLDGRTYQLEERRHEGGDRTVVVIDITELEESRARLMDAVQNVTSGFAMFDHAGMLVLGNEPFHDLLAPHIAAAEVATLTAQEIFRRLAEAGVLRLMQIDSRPASAEEIIMRVEIATGDPFLMNTPDGRTLQMRLRQSADGGRVVICSDVSLLRQMDVALRSSEAKFRGLAQASSDGVMIVDPTGEVQFANDEARRMFGYDDEEGGFDNIATLLAAESGPEQEALMKEFFAERRSRALKSGELRGVRRDGTSFPVEVALSYYETPDGPLVQATIRDITQRLRAEEAERQHAKMVALGTLAGGIAHDLNNALVPVLSLGELLLDSGTASAEDAEMLRTIVAAAERARDLVRNILAFSRRGTRSVSVVDLGAVVAKDLPMLRAVIPSSIDLDFHPATEVLPVQADEINLHQVVVNLVSNAAQAIGNSVGRISISTTSLDTDGAAAGGPKAGRHAQLTISDDGPGMDDETKRRLFEPFFTTKPVGEGTGLGLAIVHNIVTSHGGMIAVDSTPGRGTCFTIWFPLRAASMAGNGNRAA